MTEQTILLARLIGHRGGDLGKFLVALDRHGRAADERELDVDMRDELRRKLFVSQVQLASVCR